MKPKAALNALFRAAVSQQQLPVGPALQFQKMVLQALEAPAVDSSAIETIKAENVDLTMRVAELEEQLAEAKKPRRRTRKTTSE